MRNRTCGGCGGDRDSLPRGSKNPPRRPLDAWPMFTHRASHWAHGTAMALAKGSPQ